MKVRPAFQRRAVGVYFSQARHQKVSSFTQYVIFLLYLSCVLWIARMIKVSKHVSLSYLEEVNVGMHSDLNNTDTYDFLTFFAIFPS